MTAPNESPEVYGPEAPHSVVLPVMRQRWETLTFLHWAYPAEVVQRRLPPRMTVETRDGLAWVGLVAFLMKVSPPLRGAVRGAMSFPETNLRTYVIGPDGRTGVWFFSLDAANRMAVAAARMAVGLPYFLAEMNVEQNGHTVTYRSSRSQGVSRGAGHDIAVQPGPPITSGDVSEFEHFLTARFALWHRRGRLTLRIPIEHPPWQLRRGELVKMEQNLTEAASLPAPGGAPIVHFSDGIDASVGAPRLTR